MNRTQIIALAWALFSVLVTTFLKPQTPEQYEAVASKWPRVASALRLIGALGIDAPKALALLHELVFPKPKDPS